MFKRVISQAPLSVVTLGEAKAQLNIIDDTSDDTHIQLLVDSATRLAQKYTGRLFSVATVEMLVGTGKYFLPFGEVETITSAEIDSESVSFSFQPISQSITINDSVEDESVTVTFDAGYAPDKVPFEAKMGILMMVSSLYENREDTTTMTTSDIPLNSTAILDSIRILEVQ